MPSFFSSIPQDVYYPSCVVNLELRFDEGASSLSPGPQSSDVSADNVQSNTASAPSSSPALAANGNDGYTFLLGMVPKSCHVELPGFIQAGTFDFTFEYRDFPLDPRVLRAAAVSVHMDTVTATNFANGLAQTLSPTQPTGTRTSVLVPTQDNLVLYGTVDNHDVEFTDSGATVRLSGRDLRGILLDSKASPETIKKIDLTKTLDVVIDQIINTLWPMGGNGKVKNKIKIVFPPELWSGAGIPIPVPGAIEMLPRQMKDAAGQKPRNTTQGEAAKTSFWDLVTTSCNGVGAIATFVGQQIRVVPAASIYDTISKSKTLNGTKTPFAKGLNRDLKPPFVAQAETLTYRCMVFGKDIQRFHIERKLGGVKVPAVKVYSIDTAKKGAAMIVSAISPAQSKSAALNTSTSPGGQVQQTDIIPVRAPNNITDVKALQTLADSIRQTIGRQEIGGSCSTKNLASFGGGNNDPDLLRLRPGDPVEFRVDASGLQEIPPVVSELNTQAARSEAAQIAALKRRIGANNDGLARILVKTQNGSIPGLYRVFRTANVKYEWDSEQGVKIDFDFQNYITARYDVPAATGV